MFVGSIFAVLFGVIVTLYVQIYIAPNDHGAYEVSQAVWGLFLVLNVALTFALRQVDARGLRAPVAIGHRPAPDSDRRLRRTRPTRRRQDHRAPRARAIRSSASSTTRPGDHLGYRGLPLLGTIDETTEIAAREQIDHLYVALPPEQHLKMIDLLDVTARECIDVKVVPDLLQVIALKARLWDLDGVPVIDVNDIPLQGVNSIVKRVLDIAISVAALARARDSDRRSSRCSSA